MTENPEQPRSFILIVDGEIISRHAIAEYLRHCGYSVVEAANTNEAYLALGEPSLAIDIILLAVVGMDTQQGFELANWVSSNRPDLVVKLAGGVESAARTAAGLCDSGPHLKRPYEPEMVVDYIKRIRARV